jgi:molybdopterin-guanine dinucleotide biosynthesis protein A
MGRDKAVLEIGGVTFLARLRRTLEAVAVEVVVSAADAGAYPDGGLKVVADVFRRCGPLAGIHAALSAVGTGRILVVACDMPMVTADACRRLISGASRAGVTIALCGGRPQPLFGVYPKTLLPELEAALRQGRYSVLDFLRGVEVTVIDPGAAGSTVNVNTPGDYAGLLAAQRSYSTTAPSPLI